MVKNRCDWFQLPWRKWISMHLITKPDEIHLQTVFGKTIPSLRSPISFYKVFFLLLIPVINKEGLQASVSPSDRSSHWNENVLKCPWLKKKIKKIKNIFVSRIKCHRHTTPNCSEALAFHRRRLVSSLPEMI